MLNIFLGNWKCKGMEITGNLSWWRLNSVSSWHLIEARSLIHASDTRCRGVVWAVMGQHFTFYFLSGDVLSFNTRPYLDNSDCQTEAVCPGDWRFDSQNSDIIIAIIMSPSVHEYPSSDCDYIRYSLLKGFMLYRIMIKIWFVNVNAAFLLDNDVGITPHVGHTMPTCLLQPGAKMVMASLFHYAEVKYLQSKIIC